MKVDSDWLRDDAGRVLLPRGVNVGGSSKVPTVPNGATWRSSSFYEWRNVSFVGRPFPLDEADEHFARLASWGMRLVRLLVTWEAVEHSGPGEYDRSYLDYLRAVAEAAARHDVELLVDPHQDAWSRWTGGDGAPAWTLEGAGFRLEALHASGAAILHQELGDALSDMIWPTNYNRLACATMFTLFYAGGELAPGIRIFGEPAQEFLQSRYLAAMREVARALRGLRSIVGFGAMNEPSLGFIGIDDIGKLGRTPMRSGIMPTPLEAMAAGSGLHTACERWKLGLTGERRISRADLNPAGTRAWADGQECIWRRLGVWDAVSGRPVARRPGHFRVGGGLGDRYLKPLSARFAAEIRKVLPEAILFSEGTAGADYPRWRPGEAAPVVSAPHWYDGLTMVTKRYHRLFTVDPLTRKLFLGPSGIRRCFASHFARTREESRTSMGGIPTLIGELGLPFDLDRGRGYRTGDFRAHERALSAYYEALDASLLGATLWNYTSDNDNLHGDQWNREDFSIFSRDQAGSRERPDPDAGARALLGFCRPYAEKTAGIPLSMSFDRGSRRFELRFRPDPSIRLPTVIYVPRAQYPAGYGVELSGIAGMRAERVEAEQRLLVHAPGASRESGEARIVVRPARAP